MTFTPKIPSRGGRVFFAIFVFYILLPLFVTAQTANWTVLWGTGAGLYGRDQTGRVENLWTGGNVQKIIHIPAAPPRTESFFIMTEQGILTSSNLRNWEDRNNGLPRSVIKFYWNGEKSLVSTVQEIKDLSVDPLNPEIMVCTFKNAVYLSRSGGRTWENLGMPNYRSNGIKTVSVAFLAETLTVLCSHSIYGVYYINPDLANSKWTEINQGLEKLETTENPDEISSFAVYLNPSVNNSPEILASMSFRRRIYKLDWAGKRWESIWSDGPSFGTSDSLFAGRNSLTFVRDGGILELDLSSPRGFIRSRYDAVDIIKGLPGNMRPNCAVLRFPQGNPAEISLSELWLLDETARFSADPIARTAIGKEGIYLPVNHAMDPASLRPYLDLIEKRNLNMVVIDMKDDYGRLRFSPQNASLTNFGRIFRPVDIEAFIKTMKERGIFTVARIVVFKDPEAAQKQGAKYAVWDNANNKAWEGYYDTRRLKAPPGQEPETNPNLVTRILPDADRDYEILRTWYDEKWVDPYSEEIWDYNASVAEELYQRGFDEIQFDYIRFPTDGINLNDGKYRWKDPGMDMDSAIVSFLRHVRSRVKAPISVDIYGANGWYRTGARTGQEVELLAPWVDIICPMYYPSHFEQHFLAQEPAEQRPYRIYYQGTRRTGVIARGQVIVRPWAQAFYLNVSYDRKYYNEDYVRLQLEGVRNAGRGGLTYWNNVGRYSDLP